MHLFIAMEADYDGAWIYGVYKTLEDAMARLTLELSKNSQAYQFEDRYVFVEEWVLEATAMVARHVYTK